MRDKAYRYYQNKKHNDRHQDHCGYTYHRTVKRINRPNQPSGGIKWKAQDNKSITGLKSQIDEHNGLEKTYKPSARHFPTYLN